MFKKSLLILLTAVACQNTAMAANDTTTTLSLQGQVLKTTCEFGTTSYDFPEVRAASYNSTFGGVTLGEIGAPILVNCEAGSGGITMSFQGGGAGQNQVMCAQNTGTSGSEHIAIGYNTTNLVNACTNSSVISFVAFPNSAGETFLTAFNGSGVKMNAYALASQSQELKGTLEGNFPITFDYP